jgi:uncharacterized protein YjiS (DUF1127 family)
MPTLTHFGAAHALAALGLAVATLARWTAGAAASAVSAGLRWSERAEQRRRLAEMNEHMLRDIGLDRGAVWRETSKPFWRG